MKFPVKNLIVYLGCAIFLFACLAVTRALQVDEKITAMLPTTNPMAESFDYITDNVPAIEIVYIDFETLDGDTKKLETAADLFYKEAAASPFFTDIIYTFSRQQLIRLLSVVHRHRASLLDPKDLNLLAERMQPDELEKRIAQIKRSLISPSGIFTADALMKDPLGMDQMILSKLNAFKNEAFGTHFKGSHIYSRDGRHLLMMAHPAFPAVDTRQSRAMMAYLNTIRSRIYEKFDSPSLRIGFSGNHVATLDNAETIQKDVKRAVLALSIGIVCIAILFFRRLINGVLMFFPTLISMSFALAVMSLLYGRLSAISLGCGSVLLGITIDFGIHILFSADYGYGRPLEEIIRNLRRPVIAGAGTTIAAFSTLLFSSLPGQQQMGLFSIIGIMGAAFFSLVLLKFFIRPPAREPKRAFIPLVSISSKILEIPGKHPEIVLSAGIVLLVIASVGITHFRFDGDVTRLNHLQPETRSDQDRFLKAWGGTTPTLALVSGPDIESALEKNDRLFSLLNHLQEKNQVGAIASLSHILPSNKKMQQNREKFIEMMSGESFNTFSSEIESISMAQDFKKDAFKPFLDSLTDVPEKLSANDFKGTALEELIRSKLIRKKDGVMVLTTFTILDREDITGIISRIQTGISGIMILDKKYLVSTITQYLVKEFKRLFLFAAAGMILILLLVFRNLKVVLICVSPVFLAAFITAGILGLLGLSINLISMVFIIFVFGVGVDFSIFLTSCEMHRKPDEPLVAAGAVILCALTTIGAFACLALADHAALFSIGIAGLTGMLSSLILALVIIPRSIKKFLPPAYRKTLNE